MERPQTAPEPVFVTDSLITVEPDQSSIQELDFHAFCKNRTIPSLYDRPALMQYMQRLTIEAAVRGDYAEATHYSELNRRFYDACIEKEGREWTESQVEAIDEQIEVTRGKTAAAGRKWKEILGAAEDAEIRRIQDMRDAHERELQEFDARWRSDDAVRRFTKQSPKLLELRDKEKRLLLIKQFEEAGEVAKYADTVEREETELAQAAAQREAIARRVKLIERHQAEFEHLQQRALTKLAVLRQRREEELHILQRRMAHMEIDKVNVGRSRRADSESVCKMRSRTADSSGLLSPRSRGKMEDYRKQTVVTRLLLKPVRRVPTTPQRKLQIPKYEKKPLQ
jgi:hypothetical protein